MVVAAVLPSRPARRGFVRRRRDTVAAMLLVAVSLLTLLPRSPFLLLLLAGFAGLASAALFLFAGAPDVAFTQFTVEVAYIVVASVLIIRFTRGRVAAPRTSDRRAFRVVYIARLPESVYVLHAFQKTSASTSRPDIAKARHRYMELKRARR